MKIFSITNVGFLALILSLISCASIDYHLTEFQPISETRDYSTYSYRAFADVTYPQDSEDAEKTRMEWLEKWIDNNNLSSDYEIISRTAVVKHKGLLGTVYHIYYDIKFHK